MLTWTTDCIEKPIRLCLERVGRFIGLHPWWFFSVPLALSLVLGGGFYLLQERISNDIERQFTPTDGRGKTERRFFQDTFPQNASMFSSERLNTDGEYASLIFTCSTNIFTEAALEDVLHVHNRVMGMGVQTGTGQMTFSDICATVHLQCWSNTILDIVNYNASNFDKINVTFPVHFFKTFGIPLGYSVGGVTTDTNKVIESAKAIRLFYYLQEGNHSHNNAWLTEFITQVSKVPTSVTNVSYFTSKSRQQEFEGSTKSVISLFTLTYVLAISFAILSCMSLDNVRNKVWVATIGVFSSGLAVLSSFGLLLIMGVPFVMTVASSPFLILGVGMDDMFIMISCWQQTNVHDSVADRLANTYKGAAISITITTLTDVLAFFLGCSSPFGSVRSFCLYAGTAILFCYLYNVTFFGAFLALNGKREEGNRHWLTCMSVPEECPPSASKAYAICCVGGAYNHDTGTEEEQLMKRFFRKYYGPLLTKAWAKVCVIFLYAIYLAVSIYGCTTINEGIDLRNLAKDGSYIINYYDATDIYFSDYGPNVMLAINGTFPYWDVSKRKELDSCITDFEELPLVEKLSISWLHSFDQYAKAKNVNICSETTFKTHLQPFLELHPMFKQDINITTNIGASRLFLQTVNISSTSQEKRLLKSLRTTAVRCQHQLLVFHPSFIYYDQYTAIVSNTIQTVCMATAVMLVISLILIPNPLCALWVTFAIASIIVGVAGFMALNDINLDCISMINLVICIGFSVNFAAHLSYTFVSSTKPNADEKMVDVLSHLGCPMLQGAVSTVLGVVVLSATQSYIFRSFFTIMCLVILFGLLHGIAFIPVFLTTLGGK